MQANPKESKEKGLDFLGFLWWNRDFSMGYGGSKQKTFLLPFQASRNASIDHLIRPSTASQKRDAEDRRLRICIAQILNFGKRNHCVRPQPADRTAQQSV
jgi:hypothetical protein